LNLINSGSTFAEETLFKSRNKSRLYEVKNAGKRKGFKPLLAKVLNAVGYLDDSGGIKQYPVMALSRITNVETARRVDAAERFYAAFLTNSLNTRFCGKSYISFNFVGNVYPLAKIDRYIPDNIYKIYKDKLLNIDGGSSFLETQKRMLESRYLQFWLI
jgi:hypothetical protein